MSTGARWLADERLGRHEFDLGERNTSTVPSAYSGREDGDPQTTAPQCFVYPLLWRLDVSSLAALAEAADVPFAVWLQRHGCV